MKFITVLRCDIPVVYIEHKVTIYAYIISLITQLYCITKVSTSTTCFGCFDLAVIRLDKHVGETVYTSNTVTCIALYVYSFSDMCFQHEDGHVVDVDTLVIQYNCVMTDIFYA